MKLRRLDGFRSAIMSIARANRRFQFHERRPLFIRVHDETLSVSVRVCIQIARPFESTVDRNRAGSRLLFLAEFLKARIIPERIEHRIEPKQHRSERWQAWGRDRE